MTAAFAPREVSRAIDALIGITTEWMEFGHDSTGREDQEEALGHAVEEDHVRGMPPTARTEPAAHLKATPHRLGQTSCPPAKTRAPM